MSQTYRGIRLGLVSFGLGVVLATAGTATGASSSSSSDCKGSEANLRQLAREMNLRSRQLDEREQTIALRESLLREASERIDERLDNLEEAQEAITAELDRVDELRDERVGALVKMVESNRASEIAPMVAALEPLLAVEILDEMNRTKAGKLLAELAPTTAADLVSRMADPVPLEFE